ncbi:hypothetical protein PDE_07712 [Penicillium oxalicum 114-2]|uniref:Zn(2)-C6 fungal-type domain-containing protein n=1 Tax=Penicillium oxalicum (strain 114-2 / CGMCC 5302) TaxID=933388 RepID=S8BCT0_PENO1|nr:hypothetical protein PDE_07712 [Penicillium oxalicum 114-2]
MSSGTKTKARPQQSCLKCRERKVKCDRNVPCEACVSRGIESECNYLTSAEDRAHISQAEIIERLRREVAQLRDELSQNPVRSPKPAHRDRVYAQKNKSAGLRESFAGGYEAANAVSRARTSESRSATGSAEPSDLASWAGSSSPSSLSTTTGTHSVTVTSPESTGSEGSANGPSFLRQQAYSGSVDVHPGAVADVEMMATTDGAAFSHYFGDESTISPYFSESMSPFVSKIPEQIPTQHYSVPIAYPAINEGLAERPSLGLYTNQDTPEHRHSVASARFDDHASYHVQHGFQDPSAYDMTAINHPPSHLIPDINHQTWHHDPGGAQMPTQIISPSTTAPFPLNTHFSSEYYSTTDTTATPTQPMSNHSHSHHTSSHPVQSYPYTFPPHPTEYQSRAMNAIPESWKGPDKRPLLEALLETISSCDEERVAQVVAVIRASSTPENAVSGICRILGISGD